MNTNQPAPQSGTGNNDGDVGPHGPLVYLNYNGFPLMLPIPNQQDDLEVVARKVQQLAFAVGSGLPLSLLNVTVNEQEEQEARTIEDIGKERMTSHELELYENWREQKLDLPNIDWIANRFTVSPISPKHRKYARAMDIIWDHEGAVPENFAWLCERKAAYLPLVKAVMKLMAATERFGDPAIAHLNGREVTEYQTLRAIVSSTEESVNREKRRIHLLAQQIDRYKSIIQNRLNNLVNPEDMMETE